MIAHVNPASGAAENTLDTLRYAFRALLPCVRRLQLSRFPVSLLLTGRISRPWG
jgi:hypothetical protein